MHDVLILCLSSYCFLVERGSSVGRMPDSQSREPGFESPLIPFRSLGIFFQMCVLFIRQAERPSLLRKRLQNSNQDTGLQGCYSHNPLIWL